MHQGKLIHAFPGCGNLQESLHQRNPIFPIRGRYPDIPTQGLGQEIYRTGLRSKGARKCQPIPILRPYIHERIVIRATVHKIPFPRRPRKLAHRLRANPDRECGGGEKSARFCHGGQDKGQIAEEEK